MLRTNIRFSVFDGGETESLFELAVEITNATAAAFGTDFNDRQIGRGQESARTFHSNFIQVLYGGKPGFLLKKTAQV